MRIAKLNNDFKTVRNFIKYFIKRFNRDRITSLSASLSFSAIFALGPLAVLMSLILESILKNPNTRSLVIERAQFFIGSSGATFVDSFISFFESLNQDRYIMAISILLLVFSSSYFFFNLRKSLNIIFRTDKKITVKRHIIKNLLSILLVIFLTVILIISTLINSLFVKVDSIFLQNIYFSSYVISPLYFLTSLFFIMLLFAAIYKILPDRKVKWLYIFTGSFFASVLFMIGKTLFEWYIGNTDFSSVYGAASSVMIIMLLTYYSSIIFYTGAVFSVSHEKIAESGKNLN